MAETNSRDNNFLDKIRAIVHAHIADDTFGVSELADEIGMSRSNLLRKIQKSTNASASQFIRRIRLEEGMKLIKESSLNVSEISDKVGFSSTSYFIKCFREEYGFPPGEATKRIDQIIAEDKRSHKLVAIMFTDIQGYTALMQQNEQKAIEMRKRHRDIFESLTEQHNGTILQYYGDGTLSTFESAIEAVRCGIALQTQFRERPEVPVRIGIHTGDILFSKDGIAGDGVNIASRIESIASVQSVCISEKVQDEVKNQAGINTISLGIFELKNVDKPMEIFAVTNEGLKIPAVESSEKVKRVIGQENDSKTVNSRNWVLWFLIPLLAITVTYLVVDQFGNINERDHRFESVSRDSKKSIAVLPFINDSQDSSNVYIINGLMESTLTSLQKIHELRVISRTSTEKYRARTKSSPEIAQELNVKYLVEGSGQKIGNEIMLHIQLVDAQNDQHLWAESYNRELDDIFDLQMEVAGKIAEQIEIIITPDEKELIAKAPTDNVVAYEHFLKGYDILTVGLRENLPDAIRWFQKAIDEDPTFARAYAAVAITYYIMEDGLEQKQFTDQINHYADQAMIYDEKLAQSLIAKALYYIRTSKFELAADYLEKALEYNPNEDLVYVFLVDLYQYRNPNTRKYLEYALRGLEINVASYDSSIVAVSYIHISNAFAQSGFIEEAEKYINMSLAYDPQNVYSPYLKKWIEFARHKDLKILQEDLAELLEQDTTRLDIMQDLGKVCYFREDFETADEVYQRFVNLREAWNLSIYRGENAKISYVFDKVGKTKQAKALLADYKDYGENDQTVFRHLMMCAYYSQTGQDQKALEELQLYAEEDNYQYWMILLLGKDPILERLKQYPEYNSAIEQIETNFNQYNKEMRAYLEEKKLI